MSKDEVKVHFQQITDIANVVISFGFYAQN